MNTTNKRVNALRVLWNQALARRNVGTLERLSPMMATAYKPRGREANQPPNQQRAWRKQHEAYRNVMGWGAQVHVNAETAATVLKFSNSPSTVMSWLARGANVSVLTADDMKKRFKNFHKMIGKTSADAITAYARMLTELIRRGAPMEWMKNHMSGDSHLIEPLVDAYLNVPSSSAPAIAILNLMEAMIKQGVVKRSDFPISFFMEFYDYPTSNNDRSRGLSMLASLMPSSSAARRAYLEDVLIVVLKYGVEDLDPHDLQAVLNLGARLTPKLLDAYISSSRREMNRNIFAMFRRAGVRVPRSSLNTIKIRSKRNGITHLLREHNLLSSVKRPASPNHRRDVKRRRRV